MNNLPPQNIDIECACLSSALLSKSALLKFIGRVEPDDFYLDKNRIICEAIFSLSTQEQEVDLLLLTDYLKKNNQLDTIGGLPYLTEIYNSAISGNINDYIKSLKHYSKLRKVIHHATESIENAYGNEEPEKIINDLTNNLQIIDRPQIKVLNSQDIFSNGIDKFRLKREDFIKTGILGFDIKFYGLYNSEVVTIAGRPSMGKSALALNIANEVSINDPVLFFSLEMPIFFNGVRLLASETNIDTEDIIHNRLDEHQRKYLRETSEKLKQRKLYYVDQAGLFGKDINSISRDLHKKVGLKLIILDYLQIMSSSSKENRYIRIAEDMKIAKNLARDLKLPVIVISQLGREVERRTNKIPILSDLRESGDIENDSDKIIFIYFEDDYAKQGKLIVAKNKYGAKGNAEIEFNKPYCKFT